MNKLVHIWIIVVWFWLLAPRICRLKKLIPKSQILCGPIFSLLINNWLHVTFSVKFLMTCTYWIFSSIIRSPIINNLQTSWCPPSLSSVFKKLHLLILFPLIPPFHSSKDVHDYQHPTIVTGCQTRHSSVLFQHLRCQQFNLPRLL